MSNPDWYLTSRIPAGQIVSQFSAFPYSPAAVQYPTLPESRIRSFDYQPVAGFKYPESPEATAASPYSYAVTVLPAYPKSKDLDLSIGATPTIDARPNLSYAPLDLTPPGPRLTDAGRQLPARQIQLRQDQLDTARQGIKKRIFGTPEWQDYFDQIRVMGVKLGEAEAIGDMTTAYEIRDTMLEKLAAYRQLDAVLDITLGQASTPAELDRVLDTYVGTNPPS